jgi:hypothetical protein
MEHCVDLQDEYLQVEVLIQAGECTQVWYELGHAPQVLQPQSIPVSSPFKTPSPHEFVSAL